jgi:rhodanese-related sulfurtransferase
MGLALGTGLGVSQGFRPRMPEAPRTEGVCAAPVPAQPSIHWLRQEEAYGRLQQSGTVFVDARPRALYEQAHVAGAIHIPFEVPRALTAQELLLVQRASLVVTYCDTQSECGLSRKLAAELSKHVADVRVLEGGMPSWLAHGYPAESGRCVQCDD